MLEAAPGRLTPASFPDVLSQVINVPHEGLPGIGSLSVMVLDEPSVWRPEELMHPCLHLHFSFH